MSPKFSIIITTRDRREELVVTLNKIFFLLARTDVQCIVCDDGSTDDTFDTVVREFPNVEIFHHTVSHGLIYSRNKLFERAKGDYVISIDDDLNFLSRDPL